MKIIRIVLIFALLLLLTISSNAASYEYIPNNEKTNHEWEAFFQSLPEEIRRELIPYGDNALIDIIEKFSLKYFFERFTSEVSQIVPRLFTNFCTSAVIVILISITKNFINIYEAEHLASATDFCTSLVSVLTVFTMQKGTVDVAGVFLKTVSNSMKLLIPIIEAALISSGNLTFATVTASGLNTIIAICEIIYSDVLYPAVTVVFVISAIISVTGNKGLSYLINALKVLITGIIVAIITLVTFIFAIQSTASVTADNFTLKALRFALGSYVPIVGGAVSESLTMLKSSFTVIKSFAGITGIIVILLLCIPPVISLAAGKINAYLCMALSGILGCEKISSFYGEINGVYTMIFAIVLSSVIMFIVALGIICSINVFWV